MEVNLTRNTPPFKNQWELEDHFSIFMETVRILNDVHLIKMKVFSKSTKKTSSGQDSQRRTNSQSVEKRKRRRKLAYSFQVVMYVHVKVKLQIVSVH